MPAVWKPGFVGMGLYRNRSRGHEPRTIVELISQQPFHAFLISGIVRRYVSRFVEGVKRLARGVGFAWDPWKHAPTSIRILNGL